MLELQKSDNHAWKRYVLIFKKLSFLEGPTKTRNKTKACDLES